MSERELLPERLRDGAGRPVPAPPRPPLLTRLNQRGIRLVQAADAVVLLTVLVGTALVRYGWEWPTYSKALYGLSFAVALAVFLPTYYFGGLYEREPRLGYPAALPRALRLSLVAGGVFALLNLAATGAVRELGHVTERALPMPITNLVVLMALGACGVAVNRRLAQLLRHLREGPPRVLLVGAPDEVNLARAHLRDDRRRATVVAESSGTRHLVARVDEHRVTEVVLLSSRWLDSLYPDVLRELEDRDVTVLQRVSAKETMFGLERVHQIGGMPFVLLRSHTVPVSRARFKRFTDLIALGLLAPVLLPVMGVIALYQLAAVGRPLLFWQDRVGAGGRIFHMVKFRTMHPAAEEDGDPRLATREDPRIVPACRWLRATRLDELPQIWNVLRGEMSLVGPRPERPELTARFEQVIPGYTQRHELPPGITGLAQIHGRYHTDPEYKLGYDLQYLVNWSPVLDLEIMLRTIWVVATRRI